jgi:anti-sigma factor RsiW
MVQGKDSFEYSISQYLDGTLNEVDRRALEERLSTDAEARLVANEYARLNQLLKTTSLTPSVDFKTLTDRICQQIEAEPFHTSQTLRLSRVWLKRLALAAGLTLLIGAGLYWTVLRPGLNHSSPSNGVLDVQVVLVPQPQAPSSMIIEIGPTDSLKQAGYTTGLVDSSIITRPARIVIRSADPPSSNGDRLY